VALSLIHPRRTSSAPRLWTGTPGRARARRDWSCRWRKLSNQSLPV